MSVPPSPGPTQASLPQAAAAGPPARKGLSTGAVAIVLGSVGLVLLVGGGLALLGGIGVFRGSVPGDGAARRTPVDVVVDRCDSNSSGATAEVVVTNSAGGVRDFRITVGFNDSAGTQVDTGEVAVLGLRSGQRASATATGTTDRRVASCVVIDVTRGPVPDDGGGSPTAAEVAVDRCEATSSGAAAEVSVTNSTGGVRDYLITVGFNDSAGTQVDTGEVAFYALRSGQHASLTATVTTNRPVTSCVVLEVRRQ